MDRQSVDVGANSKKNHLEQNLLEEPLQFPKTSGFLSCIAEKWLHRTMEVAVRPDTVWENASLDKVFTHGNEIILQFGNTYAPWRAIRYVTDIEQDKKEHSSDSLRKYQLIKPISIHRF